MAHTQAMIGATAIELRAVLLTANVKHFAPVAGLQIEAFVP
jgi:predicted nucleic acid-binding protein